MLHIVVSGIDKSGKTTLINALMEETFYRNYIVDRDPSNYFALSVIQNNRGINDDYKKRYEKFKKEFIASVDLAVFLICDDNILENRFVESNEKKLIGELDKREHQAELLKHFSNFGYKKTIIVDTTNKTINECVISILKELYKKSYEQKIFYNDKFILKCGCEAKVISYSNKKDVGIITTHGHEYKVESRILYRETFECKTCLEKRLINGHGFLGSGIYTARDEAYKRWFAILHRTTIKGINEIYICKEWLNYQNFAKWYYENNVKGYHIDKDLKIYGNKIYSPETCTFVPRKINSFFYKNKYSNMIGILKMNKRYSSSIKYKLCSKKDAQNNYWNEKYTAAQKLICKYPNFKNLIENYFEFFFNDNYKQDIQNARK